MNQHANKTIPQLEAQLKALKLIAKGGFQMDLRHNQLKQMEILFYLAELYGEDDARNKRKIYATTARVPITTYLESKKLLPA